MRVAFITHYTLLYGANRSLLDLIEGLRAYGVAAHVIAPEEGDVTRVLRERGVPVAVIPCDVWVAQNPVPKLMATNVPRWLYRLARSRMAALRRLWHNVRALPALARQLAAWQIDIVHTNSSVTPIGALAAALTRRPHVWHLREFSDLHYGRDYDWGKGLSLGLIRRAAAQIAISESVRAYYLGPSAGPSGAVIANGIAPAARLRGLCDEVIRDGLAPSATLGALGAAASRAERPYTFAMVGRVYEAKGQGEAIRALALLAREYPDTRLLIVGSGHLDTFRALARELGVEQKVEFWGHIDDPYQAYRACDALLMCSRYEALGRATMEAMAAGRPVIGYDEAGTAELIAHERTGLLYRGGPDELAACMRRFIEDPAWAQSLGAQGHAVACAAFSTEACAERVFAVLQAVASQGRSRSRQGAA